MHKTPAARPTARRRPSVALAARRTVESLEARTLFAAAPVVINNATWSSIGPTAVTNGLIAGSGQVSGRVTDVATDPTNANLEYVTTSGGGVWKTADAGVTWAPLTDLQPSLSAGAIAVAASDPNVIYVGTGESNLSFDSGYGQGILRSGDGGLTWTTLGQQFDRQTVAKVAVDPRNPNVVLAAVNNAVSNGVQLGDTAQPAGIYRSADGGLTWVNETAATNSGTIGTPTEDFFFDIKVNPQNPDNIFATFASQANGQSGLYVSFDDGLTFNLGGQIVTGGGNFGTLNLFGRVTLAIAPSDPGTIYASLSNNNSLDLGGDQTDQQPGFIIKSTDGGQTFVLLQGVPNYALASAYYDNQIIVSPTDPNTFFIGGSSTTSLSPSDTPGGEVYESTDGGQTFTDVTQGASGANDVGNNVHAFSFDAAGRLLAGTDQGLFRLTNADPAAIQWADLNTTLATTEFFSVAADPNNAGKVIGGTQSAGTAAYTGSTAWQQGSADLSGGLVAIDPTNSDIVYASSRVNAQFFEKSTDGGVTFTQSDNGITSQANAYVYPEFAVDPNNPDRLVLGTNEILESTDGAANWQSITLAGSNGFNPNGAPVTAVAIGSRGPGGSFIYASTQDGLTFASNNDGLSFTEIDTPSVAIATANGTAPPLVRKLIVDPNDSRIVFAVVGGFAPTTEMVTNPNTGVVTVVPITGGHVYMTTDAGTTWTDVSGTDPTKSLPNVPFHTIAVSADGLNGFARVIYAGGDRGVYVTYNDGYTWTPYGTALPPNAFVNDLSVDDTNHLLAAATAGRGVYEIGTTFPAATVSGLVFNDANGDGVTVGREPGLAGVTVDLYGAGADGMAGTGDDALLAATTSGPDGVYAFSGVATGIDYVRIVPPVGYYLSPVPVDTAVATVASYKASAPDLTTGVGDANPVTGNTPTFNVAAGGTVTPTQVAAVDAGLYAKTLTISSPTAVQPPAGTASLDFLLTISPANATDVVLTYATADGTGVAGTDYTATSGTVTVPAGQTTVTVSVPVLPSTAILNSRTVRLNVTAPTGFLEIPATGTATGTIFNNNFPTVTVSDESVTRDAVFVTFLTFTVSLSSPAPFTTTVQYATVDQTAAATVDYTGASGTLVFAPGQTTQTVRVSVTAAVNPIANRTFQLLLSNPVGATLPTAQAGGIGTIISNVLPVVTVPAAAVTESLTGQTLLTFTATLNVTVNVPVTVTFATADGTAVAGQDYTATSGTLTFNPGQVTSTITVPVARRFLPGQTRTLTLNLSNPTGGPGLATTSAVGTITDLNLASIAFDGRHRATYTDALNHRVTVALRGAGTGQVVFLGTSSSRTNAYEILLDGSTATSALTVTVAGGAGGQTTLNNILISGSIGTLSAKGVNVQQGTVAVAGSANVVNLGYLAGSTLTIGGSGGSVAIVLNRSTNSSITSAIAIRSLTAQAFINTGTTPVYVTAPTVGPRHVRGNFGGIVQQTAAPAVVANVKPAKAKKTAPDGVLTSPVT